MLKFGLIPEFVGRLPMLATLEDLDELALKRILREPKNALVKQYQRLFEMEGIDLTLAEEALGAIARKAIDRTTGARGLRSIMEGILLDTMFDLPSLEGVEEVVISREVVEGTARAALHLRCSRRRRRRERVVGRAWRRAAEARHVFLTDGVRGQGKPSALEGFKTSPPAQARPWRGTSDV